MELIIGGRTFPFQLKNTEASRELAQLLPLHIRLDELNGTEKYGDLPRCLTRRHETVGKVTVGELLLWGADTLVLAYQDFTSERAFTRLGKAKDPGALAEAVGQNDVTVTIRRKEN